jgi:transcriptional regulator with XRE-family HTH domain
MSRPPTNAGVPFQRTGNAGSGELGRRLKAERIRRGFTVSRLAGFAGLEQAAITGIENRMTDPRLSTMVKLAKALDCSVDYLVGLEDE